jgi:hypothetical protein
MIHVEFELVLSQYDADMMEKRIDFAPFAYAFLSWRANRSSVVRAKPLVYKSKAEFILESDLDETSLMDPQHPLGDESMGFVLYCKKRITTDFEPYTIYAHHR